MSKLTAPSSRKGLALLLLAALALRLTLVLTHADYLGVDGGAMLLHRNYVLGDEPTGVGFLRPPLAPGWLLVPFTSIFGDNTGYKVWSALAATLPLIPVFLISSLFLGQRRALLPTAFVAVDLLHAEMLVTGALPLIGFTLIGLVAWAMLRFERFCPPFVSLWPILVFLPLIPWVNQTSAGLAMIVLPILLVAMIACGIWPVYPTLKGRTVVLATVATLAFKPITWALAVGGLVALLALPWYAQVAPGSTELVFPGPLVRLAGPFDHAWLQLAIAIGVGVAAFKYATDHRLKAIAVVVITLGALGVFMSTNETLMNIFFRSRFLMAIFLYPLFGWAWYAWRARRVGASSLDADQLPGPLLRRRLAMLLGVGVFVLVAANYVASVERQTYYSNMITTETEAALSAAPEADGFVVQSYSMANWVAAITKKPAANAWGIEPPPAFASEDRDVRCVLGWVAGCTPSLAAQRLDASHVLVDTRRPHYQDHGKRSYGAPAGQWAVTASAPWLSLVYSEGTTLLWRVK